MTDPRVSDTRRFVVIIKDRGPLKPNGKFDSKKRFTFEVQGNDFAHMEEMVQKALPRFRADVSRGSVDNLGSGERKT